MICSWHNQQTLGFPLWALAFPIREFQELTDPTDTQGWGEWCTWAVPWSSQSWLSPGAGSHIPLLTQKLRTWRSFPTKQLYPSVLLSLHLPKSTSAPGSPLSLCSRLPEPLGFGRCRIQGWQMPPQDAHSLWEAFADQLCKAGQTHSKPRCWARAPLPPPAPSPALQQEQLWEPWGPAQVLSCCLVGLIQGNVLRCLPLTAGSWWAKAPPQPVPGLLRAASSTSSWHSAAGTSWHIPCAGGWAQNACSGEQQLLPPAQSKAKPKTEERNPSGDLRVLPGTTAPDQIPSGARKGQSC